MPLPLLWIDAFTDEVFAGNPAAVVLMDAPAPEAWMQGLACELGISETAFVVSDGSGAHALRWFTPTVEVDLCGHATLAAAHAAFSTRLADTSITFSTRSGDLTCTRDGDRIALDLPAATVVDIAQPIGTLDALGIDDAVAFAEGAKWIVVEVASPAIVERLAPDIDALAAIGDGCIIVTARGTGGDADIVSRVFVPGSGIPEDPVTGAAHCVLLPHWAPKLGRTELVARQASTRGGILHCSLRGDRVELAGTAVTVLRGEVTGP